MIAHRGSRAYRRHSDYLNKLWGSNPQGLRLSYARMDPGVLDYPDLLREFHQKMTYAVRQAGCRPVYTSPILYEGLDEIIWAVYGLTDEK